MTIITKPPRIQATTALKSAQVTVSRVASAIPGTGLLPPLPVENAYLVALQLDDAGAASLWKSSHRLESAPLASGSVTIAHLEEEPAFELPDPFDMLHFLIPRIAFDELSDEHRAPRICELASEVAVPDPVVDHLGRALLPMLDSPQEGSRLLFDHVVFAIHARLASVYGRQEETRPLRGLHLAPWQERTALDLLTADLSEEPPIAEVANACGMPVSRFVRAFRGTTGMPPFRWLRRFRVERAKELLVHSALSLAQVAYECGFADQSHFSRVFVASSGITPGAWRRARRG